MIFLPLIPCVDTSVPTLVQGMFLLTQSIHGAISKPPSGHPQASSFPMRVSPLVQLHHASSKHVIVAFTTLPHRRNEGDERVYAKISWGYSSMHCGHWIEIWLAATRLKLCHVTCAEEKRDSSTGCENDLPVTETLFFISKVYSLSLIRCLIFRKTPRVHYLCS